MYILQQLAKSVLMLPIILRFDLNPVKCTVVGIQLGIHFKGTMTSFGCQGVVTNHSLTLYIQARFILKKSQNSASSHSDIHSLHIPADCDILSLVVMPKHTH